MATVELTIQVTQVPDEVATNPCTAYYMLTIPYHHAMAVEAWRDAIAHELEDTATRIRLGQHDPAHEHEHHAEQPAPAKARRRVRSKGAAA